MPFTFVTAMYFTQLPVMFLQQAIYGKMRVAAGRVTFEGRACFLPRHGYAYTPAEPPPADIEAAAAPPMPPAPAGLLIVRFISSRQAAVSL